MAGRRDRRGRGPRGPIVPAGLPGHRSRAERFADLVHDSLRRLSVRWGRELSRLEVTVEDVPTEAPAGQDGGNGLGRALPGDAYRPPRVVVYRRPVEARADGDLRELVHEAVVLQVADLLGRAPEEIDPELPD